MKIKQKGEHSNHLLTKGYCLLKNAVPERLVESIDSEFQSLNNQASQILHCIKKEQMSYTQYYQQGNNKFIVVPEVNNSLQTCRFEYLQGSSNLFRDEVVPLCEEYIQQLIEQKVCLFKDKCNLKSPGGGAFPAHQDILAYLQFGPVIHVTAALILDPATMENGALQFAENYLSLSSEVDTQWLTTGLGELPVFSIQEGGENHGKIVSDIENQLVWSPAYTEPGDLLLFNSYIPHQSKVNLSKFTRRAFFFTFNLEKEGDFYEHYYEMKRADFDNPQFHVATPTEHKIRYQ